MFLTLTDVPGVNDLTAVSQTFSLMMNDDEGVGSVLSVVMMFQSSRREERSDEVNPEFMNPDIQRYVT